MHKRKRKEKSMEFEYLNAFGDDMTFCLAKCRKDCRRKPEHIIDKRFPHSFSDFSEVCEAYEPEEEREEENK